MRQHGATVTDVIILVVAATEGVRPQTKECIRIAEQANVPIVVAINKCDLHDANPARTREQLLQVGDDDVCVCVWNVTVFDCVLMFGAVWVDSRDVRGHDPKCRGVGTDRSRLFGVSCCGSTAGT